MPTAQEQFGAMLWERIAPALRDLGFKGSGATYTLPDAEDWIILGFQKSAWSDAALVRFTANLTVISKVAWADRRKRDPWLPERPSANTKFGQPAEQARLGMLASGGRDDHWWEVGSESDTERVAQDVIAAIRGHAVPWIEEHRRVPSRG